MAPEGPARSPVQCAVFLWRSTRVVTRLVWKSSSLWAVSAPQVGNLCGCVYSPPSTAWASCPSVVLYLGFFAEDTCLFIFSPCVPGVLFCSGKELYQ